MAPCGRQWMRPVANRARAPRRRWRAQRERALAPTLNGADESFLLYGAKRILAGDALYRDFFDFVAPGSFYLYTAAYAVGDVSITTARVTTALLNAAGIACTYLLALRVAAPCGLAVLLRRGAVRDPRVGRDQLSQLPLDGLHALGRLTVERGTARLHLPVARQGGAGGPGRRVGRHPGGDVAPRAEGRA